MDGAAANGILDVKGLPLMLDQGGSGQPVLLLHGGGGPQGKAPFARRLMERFRVISPTHPGFARAPLPDHFDSIHDLAYLYLDLLDQLDLRDVVLVGFSLGGWLACEIAIRNTARIDRLALVDSVGIKVGDRETRDIPDIFAMSPLDQRKLMVHDASKLAGAPPPTDEEMVIAMRNREAMAVYGWEPYLHNPKLRGLLHRIDVPTLVLWGESDRLVTPDYGRALAEGIPGARFIAIPQAGHAPQIEQPELFLDHLLRFVAG